MCHNEDTKVIKANEDGWFFCLAKLAQTLSVKKVHHFLLTLERPAEKFYRGIPGSRIPSY